MLNQISKKTNLPEAFTNRLLANSLKRHELVNEIADILKIERESASRRINGKVQFTVQEIGMLAARYDISLDDLLNGNNQSIPLNVESPLTNTSIDQLIERIDITLDACEELQIHSTETGSVFNSLPMEFFIPYPLLCKFMYFKWGHFFVGSDEFFNFSSWELPERVNEQNERIMNIYNKFDSVLYIWDVPVIWNLANDINYFRKLHILSAEEVKLLKNDVHELLHDIELIARGISDNNQNTFQGKTSFYIPGTYIGVFCSYFKSREKHFCLMNSNFMQTPINKDISTTSNIKDWIHALTKISTLISDSGGVTRRLFFEQQHKIIDHIIST